MQVGIKFTISFIWFLGYLVPPQWERDRLLGVHNEHILFDRNWRYETSSRSDRRSPEGGGRGVRMRNWKMRNVRPSRAFSPEVPLGVFYRTSASNK
jgi:hypothetical protein